MRMWMIDPKFLCRKHLLGEHNEIHKHRHNFEKKHSVAGRVTPIVLIEPKSMGARHDELVDEMVRRGYNHKSPYTMPDINYLSTKHRDVTADVNYNIVDLSNRCEDCRDKLTNNQNHL